MNELSSLKNIGNTSAFWLKTVGINSYDDLKGIGAVQAYVRIQDYGIKTSKSLLYSLHGALIDQYWKDIDPNTKQQLCQSLEEELKKEKDQLEQDKEKIDQDKQAIRNRLGEINQLRAIVEQQRQRTQEDF